MPKFDTRTLIIIAAGGAALWWFMRKPCNCGKADDQQSAATQNNSWRAAMDAPPFWASK
jgi:hypothetical protein